MYEGLVLSGFMDTEKLRPENTNAGNMFIKCSVSSLYPIENKGGF